MKKLTKFSIALVLGLIVCGIASASGRVDKEFSILDGSNLSIEDMSITDVFVGLSPDDTVHITYYKTEYFEYEIEQNDDELVLKQIALSHSGFGDKKKVVVLIPSQFNGALSLDTSTGNMSVSDVAASRIDLRTTTGDIRVEQVSSKGDVTLRSETGDISMVDVHSDSGILTVDTSTGNKILDTVSATSILLSTSSGRSNLNQVSCTDINIKGESGRVELSKLNAQNISISITTGDIRGSIVGSESDFTVQSSTSTGKNNLSENKDSGHKSLDVSTTTGHIDISFTE